MKITVTMKYGAARTVVHYHSMDHFVVSVRDKQETFRLKYQLQELLAEYFGVEVEAVHILPGHQLMVKMVEIDGGQLPDDHYQHKAY